MPHAGATTKIRVHAAAREVRRRHHRNRFTRDVDPVLETTFVDRRKPVADESRRHRREIKEHIGFAARRQFLLDRPRHDVTRSQGAARIDRVHEPLAPRVEQHATFAAQGLGHEKPRRILLGEDRRVKLHVLEVDQPRPDAVRHRHPVADAARLVRRVQENLPEPAGREHGFLRHDRHGLARLRVEHVGPKARERLVVVRDDRGVVRERQEVDCHPARAAGNLRRRVNAAGHRREDGVTRRILGVDDPARAVTALPRQVEPAAGFAVEADVEFVQQKLLHRPRPFPHEMFHRRRVRRAVAGRDDVARQQCRIRRRVVDDTALRPIAVGRQRFREREQFDGKAKLRHLQRVRRAGQPGPDDQTVGVKDLHAREARAARPRERC